MWTASKVKQFIKTYVRIDGSPAKLLPWQEQRLIDPLFQVPRKYKKVQLWLPKKSGKSAIASILLLVMMLERAGANCCTLASTVQQAKIIFDGASKIIAAHPWLRDYFVCRPHVNRIEASNGSVCQVLSGTPRGKAGYNLDFLCVDEIGAFSASYARQVIDQLSFSTMARPDAVQVYMSTAQFQREGHIAFDMFKEAVEIQTNPDKDTKQLAIVYSFPESLDWKTPELWWPYLPSCPAIIPKQFYLDEFAKLKDDSLAEARFRTLLLNQYLGLSADRWLDGPTWAACKRVYTEAELHGCKAWGGLDMSRRFDLTAWSLLVERDGELFILPRFFIPEEGAEAKQRVDGFPFVQHAALKSNNLMITPGAAIEPQYVRDQIVRDHEHFRIQSIGYDPAWLCDESRQILDREHGIEMVEVKPTPKVMSMPTSQFERYIRTKRIFHSGNPLLDWCCSNAILQTSRDGAIITKAKNTARIDGMTASIIALSRYMDRATRGSPLIFI